MIGTIQWTTYGQGLITQVVQLDEDRHPLVAVRLHGPRIFKTHDGWDFDINWNALIDVWAELMGPVKAPGIEPCETL